MIAFLRWARSIGAGALNGLVKFAVAVAIVLVVLTLVGLARGDGLPGNMVLTLDLRKSPPDSTPPQFVLGAQQVSVMDIVLGLDAAGRDPRVKGLFVRLGDAGLSIADAEEIGAAFKRFRATGKFVIAHAQGFEADGLGDYLTAAAADEIWMQPKSIFGAAGEGGGEIFLRGLLDKVQAVPQIAKRAEYKSAADMYMEKDMSAPDREQLTALMQSWYNDAVAGVARDRKLAKDAVARDFDASPQFTEDAKKDGLIDRLGYDDDARGAAIARAGGASLVPLGRFVYTKYAVMQNAPGPEIALVEVAGDIVEGTAGNGLFDATAVIAGDNTAATIRQAAADASVKAILLRVDSPGGSVIASDQILDAVKKAQARGKPVVVSMGGVAASGGYYIATSANKIVAEPGTITGSIGVLTGKVSIGKTLGLIGVGADQVGIGRNALMNSGLTPYSDDEWATVNAEADAIYADFTKKVAVGRKLPLAKVQDIARGRVWSGADARAQGLVDELGGFWTAAAAARKLAGIPGNETVVFRRYPRRKGLLDSLEATFGGSTAMVQALENFSTLMSTPVMREAVSAARAMPRAGVALRAVNLPVSR